MKSDFVGLGEADLISSEAKAEDFIRACEDFIVQSTISLTFPLIFAIIKQSQQKISLKRRLHRMVHFEANIASLRHEVTQHHICEANASYRRRRCII